MCMDFCSKCGCWIGSLEGVIRQSNDGDVEVLCNECAKIEHTLQKAISDVSLISSKIVCSGRSCAFG